VCGFHLQQEEERAQQQQQQQRQAWKSELTTSFGDIKQPFVGNLHLHLAHHCTFPANAFMGTKGKQKADTVCHEHGE
jgi:hypothetical protein